MTGVQTCALPISTRLAAQQLPNPVAQFVNDNNGAIVKLPVIAAGGANGVTGSLVFGVGTQADNQLDNTQQKIFPVNATTLQLTTTFNGQTLNSYIDSGSNMLFFPTGPDPVATELPDCGTFDSAYTGFYCPSTVQALTATIPDVNATPVTVGFSVANAIDLSTDPNNYSVFNDLAGSYAESSIGACPSSLAGMCMWSLLEKLSKRWTPRPIQVPLSPLSPKQEHHPTQTEPE